MGALQVNGPNGPYVKSAEEMAGRFSAELMGVIRDDAYRQLILLSALRGKWGLLSFGSPSAAESYRSAQKSLAAAKAYRPSHGVRFAEAFCWMGLGELDKFETLPDPEPTSAADFYFVGILHFWLAAIDDPFSRLALGRLRKIGGIDFETPRATAEWMLRPAARLEPQYYWNHFWLGWSLSANSDYKGAELAYNSCVALRPDYALSYAERAGTLVRQLDKKNSSALNAELSRRAIQDLDRAVALDPYDSRIHLERAFAFANLGRAAETVEAGARAIELERPLPTWKGRRIYFEKRQWIDEVGKFGQQISETEPDSPDAWALQALANLELGNFEPAADAVSKCLELRPDHSRALAVRGTIHLRSKRFDLALVDFDASVAGSKSYLASFGKARVYELTDRLTEAQAAFEQLGKMSVTEWQRVVGLIGESRVRARLGHSESSRSKRELARQIAPHTVDLVTAEIFGDESPPK